MPGQDMHAGFPDLNVAYGVPFEPETWPRAEDDAQCLWDDGSCGPCSQGPQDASGGQPPWIDDSGPFETLARMQAAERAAPDHMHRPGTAGPGRVWAVMEDGSYATVPAPQNCMGKAGGRYSIIWDSDPESAVWRKRCAPCLPGQVRFVRPDGSIQCSTPFAPIGCQCPTRNEPSLGQTDEEEARHARNALIVLAVVGAAAISGSAYFLYREARGG